MISSYKYAHNVCCFQCSAVSCGAPPKLDNGWVKFKSVDIGAKAYYVCKFGYILKGYGMRYCQANGHWSGTTPQCSRRCYGDDCYDD